MPGETHTRKLQPVGNSTGMTIPPSLLDELDLSAGDAVLVATNGDTLTVEKVTASGT